mmetsp:Transcript_5116/g.10544  ORF Transcript_5116/g.10544 Transcript_5116/m.10544 type:complete len:262 (+) Transcript_5116:2859-3644(+)
MVAPCFVGSLCFVLRAPECHRGWVRRRGNRERTKRRKRSRNHDRVALRCESNRIESTHRPPIVLSVGGTAWPPRLPGPLCVRVREQSASRSGRPIGRGRVVVVAGQNDEWTTEARVISFGSTRSFAPTPCQNSEQTHTTTGRGRRTPRQSPAWTSSCSDRTDCFEDAAGLIFFVNFGFGGLCLERDTSLSHSLCSGVESGSVVRRGYQYSSTTNQGLRKTNPMYCFRKSLSIRGSVCSLINTPTQRRSLFYSSLLFHVLFS